MLIMKNAYIILIFKQNDHNNCPTCECAEPCEGFLCPVGSQCEVATDPLCKSGSSLCASWPVCKPSLAYSNPCEVGTPLSDNVTNEIIYCYNGRFAEKAKFQKNYNILNLPQNVKVMDEK